MPETNSRLWDASADSSKGSPARFDLEKDLSSQRNVSHLEEKILIERGSFKIKLSGILQPDHEGPVEIVEINPQAEGIEPTRFPSTKRIGEAALDYDGSPTAYMPGDVGADKLRNGGSNLKKPYGYRPNDINHLGGYVSTTAWQKRRGSDNDQGSYVDARRIPYVAMPGSYFKKTNGGKYGDFVRLTNKTTKKTVWAIVADSRESNDEGVELSLAAAKKLGIEFKRAGTMKNAKGITLEAFRGSASGKWYE